ncbi:hypothetical protein As57867_016850, partial [Aphanomyces stellatus]
QTPTSTDTPEPTPETTPKRTPSLTPRPTSTEPTPKPTPSRTASQTPAPTTTEPSAKPTPHPTPSPTGSLTPAPTTTEPSVKPTPKPTASLTPAPTSFEPKPTPSRTTSTPITTEATPTPTSLVPTPVATPVATSAKTTHEPSTMTPAPTRTPIPTDLTLAKTTSIAPLSNLTSNLLNVTKEPVTRTPSDSLVALAPPSPSSSSSSGDVLADETAPPRHTPTKRPRDATNDKDADDLSQISTAGADTTEAKTSRYIFNAVVGLTLVFLVFFHYMAIDPSFVAPDSTLGAFTAANSWELPTFASIMQLVALVSCASVDAPHTVFVSFTDSFSWLNLLVHGTTKKDVVAAASLLSGLGDDVARRRALHLANDVTYDPFGFGQFALRVHLPERDLFVRAWTCFFVVLAILLVLVIASSLVSQLMGKRETSQYHSTSSYSSRLKHASRRVRSFVVLFLTLAVLPLSAVSTYEVMQDAYSEAGFGSMSGILAVVALVVVGGVILGAAVTVYRRTEVELSKYHTKITFGVLYTNYSFEYRLFFAVTLLVHYVTGIFMAALVQPSMQLLLLVLVHVAYLVAMVVVRPFVSTFHLVFAATSEVVAIALFGFVYGMASTGDAATKKYLGYAVVVMVCVAVVFVFVRCLVKLWNFVGGIGASHEKGGGMMLDTRSDNQSNRTLNSIREDSQSSSMVSPLDTVQIVLETNHSSTYPGRR